jgi:hypothetical protein
VASTVNIRVSVDGTTGRERPARRGAAEQPSMSTLLRIDARPSREEASGFSLLGVIAGWQHRRMRPRAETAPSTHQEM